MDNLLAYIKWRGDLLFSQNAFNEIDALILSVLSYVEWDHIVGKEKISLKKACERFTANHSEEENKRIYAYSLEIPELVSVLIHAKRYEEIEIGNYVSIFDEQKEVQFAAVTFIFLNHVFLSYRGTDSTMVGWKEDLHMTHMDDVASQRLALSYFNETMCALKQGNKVFFMRKKKMPLIYLGGHSKGGNLAMYAAFLSSYHQDIVKVFNFDGPGFRSSFYEKHDIAHILPKVFTYAPQSSIIGRLLKHREEYIIFAGQESGLAQHSAFCWMIEKDRFQYVDTWDAQSDETKTYLETTLLSKSDTELKDFVVLLFSVIEKLEIKSINDLSEISLRTGLSGINELIAMNSEERRFFISCLRFVWSQTKALLFNRVEGKF